MDLLNLTLPAPADNIALDEALLLHCEQGHQGPLLRLWESPAYMVVLGRSNKARAEVDLEVCTRDGIPVIRRCSGGSTVLLGPGCLNYSLILETTSNECSTIAATNQYMMTSLCQALRPVIPRVEALGHTDLVVAGRKFSGNAQCRKTRFFLFHGTFLLGFDAALIEKYLRFPSQVPEYRQGRKHSDFVMTLDLSAGEIKRLLIDFWQADEVAKEFPQDSVKELVEEKYAKDGWNLKY
jgi:lipoate-protein ligase A